MNPKRIALLVLISACLLGVLYADETRVELRIMTFNIWYGGDQFSFGQVAEEIRAAHPDIVGIQESDGNLRKIADAIGYPYVDEQRYIISRFPLFGSNGGEAPQAGPSFEGLGRDRLFTFVLVAPGAVVALANTHLTSDPFGPDAVRDGKTAEEVMKLESELRLPQIAPYAQTLSGLMKQGIPVFLTGDFNSPSHLDWIQSTVGARPHVRYPFEWPVTKALADSGLRDSFREIYPDPLKKPGLTWTPGYPSPWVKPNEIKDRIDYIWSGGNTVTLSSQIVGESGNPDVDIVVSPYPADHRAVVSTFRVTPAPTPALIAVDRRITEGNDFLVRLSMPQNADWGLAIVPHGGIPAKDTVLAAKGPNLLSTRPSIRLGTLGLKPGSYDAVLLDAASKELNRSQFWLIPRGATPEIKTEKTVYKFKEPIRVSWRYAPGMKNDWIAVYKADDPDIYGGYISYLYTGASIEGSTVFDAKSLPDGLPPGDYEARLLRDDSYVLLATSRFTVQK